MNSNRKVGIITLFHNSNNYGGLLQAYALCRLINQKGFDAEIIDYDFSTTKIDNIRKMEGKNLTWAISRITKIPEKIYKKIFIENYEKNKYDTIKHKVLERNRKNSIFRENIKHSQTYTFDNINECFDDYDYFISGSDQIWKPGVVDDCFTFNFIKDSKNKVIASYASSISVDKINDYYINYMKDALNKYKIISVREKNSANILSSKIAKKIDIALDPTLLIDKKHWKSICKYPNINEKYIFCYLLGSNKKHRIEIKKIANNNLKIVAINHMKDNEKKCYRKCDEFFCDFDYTCAGVNEFLGLIDKAEYIFTDSFHACIFSYIFNKSFYVIERNLKKSLNSTNSRIYNLLDILNLNDRMITSFEINLNHINYDNLKNDMETFKRKSIDLLDLIFK